MGILSLLGIGKKSVPISPIIADGIGTQIITKDDTLSFYNSWIWACIEKRAKAFASVKFNLYKLKNNGDLEQVLSHPLLELLYKVNPDMTKFDFLELSMTYLDLYGASPWYLERNGTSKVQALYLMRPEFLTIKKSDNGTIIDYEYKIGTFHLNIAKEDIIMLKNYNPAYPEKGLGTIEAVRMNAQQDDYMTQSNVNLLLNDTRLSGVLEIPSEPSAESLKRLEKEWGQKYAGYENTSKMKVLTEGMKYVPIGISPRDLDFVNSQKFNRDKILAIFGVPIELLGNLQTANRASAEAVSYIFYKGTIEPLVNKYIEQLNEFLVPNFGPDLWLDFEPLAKEDQEQQVNKINTLVDKVITRNEARDILGYGAVEGGDILFNEFSKMPLTETNTARETSGLNTDKSRYIKSRIMNRDYKLTQLRKDIEDNIVEKLIKEGKNNIKKNKENNQIIRIVEEKSNSKKKISKEMIARYQRARVLMEEKLVGSYEKKMDKFFKAQQERYLSTFKNNGIVNLKGLDGLDEIWATVEIIEPELYKSVMNGGKLAIDFFGPKFVPNNKWISEWTSSVAIQEAKTITDTTQKELIKTLTEGTNDGEGLEKLKLRVKEVFDFASETRAKMIARTEITRGLAEGQRQNYKQMGYNRLLWVLSDGACDICIAKAKQDDWDIDNIEGQQPVHPNCFDKETEVYTNNGFKLFKDLTKKDKIWALNPETLIPEFVKYVKFVEYEADKMVRYIGKSFDLVNTDDHTQFGNLRKKGNNYELIKDKDIPKWDFKFMSGINWKGKDKKEITINRIKFDTKVFCRFMGWYLSEGCVSKRSDKCYQIEISQKKYYKEMVDDMKKLPLKIAIGKNVVYINNIDLGEYLMKFGKSAEKYIPKEIKELSPEYINEFLYTFCLGDGSLIKGKIFKGFIFDNSRTFTTSSKIMADDLGELIMKVGKKPTFYTAKTKGKSIKFKNGTYIINNDQITIRENNNVHSLIEKIKRDIIVYKDTVYDVELEKYHILLVRRNGKVVWSGNCSCSMAPKGNLLSQLD
jgi:HK97 family phage portal protein